MSANTQALNSGAASGMGLEGWCVLVMGALFGLFLLSVWWELRSSLRSVSAQAQRRERAVARLEAEAALSRQIMREAASARLAALRAAEAAQASAQVLAASAQRDEAAPAMGMESVGRILDRLAQPSPRIAHSIAHSQAANAERPALNMVRGGLEASEPEGAADAEGEDAGNVALGAASRRSRAGSSVRASAGARGKARDGVKSSSVGSGAISSGALFASR